MVALTALAAVLALATLPAVAVAADPPDCAPVTEGGPVQVSADCVDPLYTQPVIDSESDESLPAPHHRVAGHFEGTSIDFTVYLPPAEQWEGRFFQYTYPLTGAEADDRAIGFALESGGYAVQAGRQGGTSLGYRHAAAAAKYAETIANAYYGSRDTPIYGYLYGPSGGSFQTIGAAENTDGVWEGFVPMVLGVPMSTPYTFFIRAMADLILGDRADQISDAVLPGGSGDPYAGLDEAEQAMLRELVSFGIPVHAWENPDYLLGRSEQFPDGLLGFGDIVRTLDPTYVEDFWNQPGYLGTEASPLGDAVRQALTAAGDTVDARWDIALRSYYRHQLPAVAAGYAGFEQFRAEDGTALYPQRPMLLGPLVTASTSGGASFSGQIHGKMIVVDNLYDVDAPPYHADWYAQRVSASLGSVALDASFRLYYNERADHQDAAVSGFRATYLVDWYGIVEQSLRDLAAWVEDGVAAPASTRYTVSEDSEVLVNADAGTRGGLQPTADLSVAGTDHIDVEAGQPVTFSLRAQMPPGLGWVVQTAWDFAGDGSYETRAIAEPTASAEVETTHVFTTPGTYMVAAQAAATRDGTTSSPFALARNLDRVRVVVHAAEAPVVILTADPAAPDGSNGWYRSPVTVTGTATDNLDPTPTLQMDVDAAGFIDGLDTVTMSDGNHTVRAQAVDVAGNTSNTVTWQGSIDTTAPIVTAAVDPATATVTIEATDTVSGIARVEYAPVLDSSTAPSTWLEYDGPITLTGRIAFRAADLAGNTAQISLVDNPARTTLSLSKSRASRGDTVVVLGEHVPTGSYDVVLRSEPVTVARATADGNGTLTVSFRLADDITSGDHTVQLVDQHDIVLADAALVVVDPTADLAATGVGIGGLACAALALLGLGAGTFWTRSQRLRTAGR